MIGLDNLLYNTLNITIKLSLHNQIYINMYISKCIESAILIGWIIVFVRKSVNCTYLQILHASQKYLYLICKYKGHRPEGGVVYKSDANVMGVWGMCRSKVPICNMEGTLIILVTAERWGAILLTNYCLDS